MNSTIFPSLPSYLNLPSIQALVIIYTPLIYLTIILLPTLPILLNIQNSNLPPGPWYTHFTNLVLKYHEWNGNRRIYIHNLHKKHGDSVRIGVNEFAFCGSEGVKGVYGNEGGELDKTRFYGLFRQLGVRTTFSTETRLEHKEKKKHIAKPYRNSEIIKPAIIDGIEERSQAFLRKIEDSENGFIDVYRYAHCFALDCASHFLLGKMGIKSIEEKTGMEIMEEMTYHSSLKKTQIAAEILDHLAAGIDTTGASLTYLLHTLSLPSNLPIQEKLHLSLNSQPHTPKSENPSAPYLNAIINETLRLYPPIPMSQPRLTSPSTPRIINQYLIPPNSTISIQAWSLHRNPAIFGDEAETFCPERWLVDEDRVREMERGFLAFGRGGRACTGKDLALAEMRHLIRRIYTQYRTKIVEGYEADMEMEDQIISSRPRGQECMLIFEKR
ncbi:putative benzoate 4-monooxygenase cytochrome p450 protein [Botrytis fragariae]|uniref:Putative benzoate 4-monooxygenase cytochrome p450 protein n=1 Tax=Botrytis fragariae TaxID=1964551 RepID=A0A8H6EP93_9HELO|nr:putative benzoate 4-monooxygenase cytochrome p450 protein [Botrytis fragariae]KAF5879661.1 putative benzoate 4-monooxygenase cytochrome p450 protein [Botrytis fragariae]